MVETWVSYHKVILFESRFGVCVCVCLFESEREREREWITQSDELGFALDPHPCAGACSHLYTVLHSSLQTPNYHWTDGCIHRLIDMKASFVGQTPDLTKTDAPDRFHREVVQYIANIFSLEAAELTLYSCMMPFCWSEGGGSQDTLIDVLLWFPTVSTVTCCGGAPGADGSWGVKRLKKQKKTPERMKSLHIIHFRKWCFLFYLFLFSYVKQGFLSPSRCLGSF